MKTIKTARLKGANNERIKSKAKQLPIEEVKLSAIKYDQLQKQKKI